MEVPAIECLPSKSFCLKFDRDEKLWSDTEPKLDSLETFFFNFILAWTVRWEQPVDSDDELDDGHIFNLSRPFDWRRKKKIKMLILDN